MKSDDISLSASADLRAAITATVVLAAIKLLPTWAFVGAALWLLREVYFKPTVTEPLPIPELATGLDADVGPTTEQQRRTCVVTGASGFLARHLIEHLLDTKAYDEIRAVDIVTPKYTQPGVVNVTANISKLADVERAIRGAGTVFHVASLIDVRDTKFRTHRLWDVNVTGCTNIANCCIRFGVERLVYTSSFAAVADGRRPEDHQWTEEFFSDVKMEDLPCLYAKTKRMGEQRVCAANGRGRLNTVCLRPSVPFGPGDKLQTHRVAYEGALIHTSDSLNISSFIYCKNWAVWQRVAAEKLPELADQIGGKAFFIDNGGESRDGVVSFLAYRHGITKRRTKNPVWFEFFFTETIRRTIYVGNAIAEWCLAGKGTWDILICNKNGLFYTLEEAKFDCSRFARLIGYKQRFTMEEAYDDIKKDLDL